MKKINEQYAMETGLSKNNQEVTTLYKTHFKMNNEFYKLDEPTYLKSWYFTPDTKDTRVTLAEIEHEMILNDWSRWNTELKRGEPLEVSEIIYYHMLSALPPKNWNGNYYEVGEPHHHENGKPIHRAFWQVGNKYFTGYPKH